MYPFSTNLQNTFSFYWRHMIICIPLAGTIVDCIKP